MKYNFDEAHAIIEDLQQALGHKKQDWEEIKELNPNWEQLSDENWMQTEARCWLHGATDVAEANELERWLFDRQPLSDTAKEKASKCLKYWKQWLEQSDAYYADFKDFELEKPHKDEILRDYIVRMAAHVEMEGKGARLEWRALKSFLAYMRNIVPEKIAFIEQIFPKKMDIHYGRIIRKIAPEVYPITQEVARNILYELAQITTKARVNNQLSALESLGLSWLCLTASRLRLPTYLEMIESMEASSISIQGKYPTLMVPSLFGAKEIRVSNRMAKFMLALSKIPSGRPRNTILQSPRRSLTRTLDRAIQNCAVNPALVNITYVTFLSTPHHC